MSDGKKPQELLESDDHAQVRESAEEAAFAELLQGGKVAEGREFRSDRPSFSLSPDAESIRLREERPVLIEGVASDMVRPSNISESDQNADTSSRLPSTLVHEFELELPDGYKIVDRLPSDSHCDVYRIQMESSGETAILKVLMDEFAHDENIRERYMQSMQKLSEVVHSRVLAVLDCGELSNKRPYVVYEEFDGVSLREFMDCEGGRLSIFDSICIASQVCHGLEEARLDQLIHLDLSPTCILVSKTDGNLRVKICDFGVGRVVESDVSRTAELTRTSDIFGSPLYLSPEQCQGERTDTRADVYSVGCLLYEMLTGRQPFSASNPLQIILRHLEDRPEPFAIEFDELRIPKILERYVMKCLEKDPKNRFSTPGKLAKLLDSMTGARSCRPIERVLSGVLRQLVYVLTFFFSVFASAPLFGVSALLVLPVFLILFWAVSDKTRTYCDELRVDPQYTGQHIEHFLLSTSRAALIASQIVAFLMAARLVSDCFTLMHADRLFESISLPIYLIMFSGALIAGYVAESFRDRIFRTKKQISLGPGGPLPLRQFLHNILVFIFVCISFVPLNIALDKVDSAMRADPLVAKIPVFAASRDIPKGTVLTRDDLVEVKELAKRAHLYGDLKVYHIVGRKTLEPLVEGQSISRVYLAD